MCIDSLRLFGMLCSAPEDIPFGEPIVGIIDACAIPWTETNVVSGALDAFFENNCLPMVGANFAVGKGPSLESFKKLLA